MHVCSVVSNSLRPHELQPARLLCPWDFPGNNTRVSCYSLLQEDLPKPGMESRSPVLQADSLLSEAPAKPSFLNLILPCSQTHISNSTCVLINMPSGVYFNNNSRRAWKLPLRCQFLVTLSKSLLVYEFNWGTYVYSVHCDLLNSFKSRFPHRQYNAPPSE